MKFVLSPFSLAQSVNAIFAVAIFISYGLQCYVPVEIIWTRYLVQHLQNASPTKKLVVEYVMRVSVVLITCEYNDFFPSFFFVSIKNDITTFKLQMIHLINERLCFGSDLNSGFLRIIINYTHLPVYC